MTPKEKAKDLINCFRTHISIKADKQAKKWALICVKELIKANPKEHTFYLAVEMEIHRA